MTTRRSFIIAFGTAVSTAGCVAPSNESGGTTSDRPVDTSVDSNSDDTQLDSTQDRSPTGTVRQLYRALIHSDIDRLNTELIHPASPTYPVQSSYLPPEAFREYSRVIIDSAETVSVQSRIVQRLATNVYVDEIMQAMGVDDVEYVHTTFYLKKPEEERAYEANTVDITVAEDTQWYVRYNARKSTHAARQSETANSSS